MIVETSLWTVPAYQNVSNYTRIPAFRKIHVLCVCVCVCVCVCAFVRASATAYEEPFRVRKYSAAWMRECFHHLLCPCTHDTAFFVWYLFFTQHISLFFACCVKKISKSWRDTRTCTKPREAPWLENVRRWPVHCNNARTFAVYCFLSFSLCFFLFFLSCLSLLFVLNGRVAVWVSALFLWQKWILFFVCVCFSCSFCCSAPKVATLSAKRGAPFCRFMCSALRTQKTPLVDLLGNSHVGQEPLPVVSQFVSLRTRSYNTCQFTRRSSSCVGCLWQNLCSHIVTLDAFRRGSWPVRSQCTLLLN